MRFKFPDKELMKTLYSITRKLYKKDIYEFSERTKLKVFYINSSTVNAVVVIDSFGRRLNVFYTKEGYITCHNLFSGDELSLYSYGFTMLAVEEITDEYREISGLDTFLKKYKHHKVEDKVVAYFSTKKGQLECVIDEEETVVLIETLSYLLNIEDCFAKGYEVVDTDEEMVAVFEFDDENYTYTSSYALLENFDFMPKDFEHERKNKQILDGLKEMDVKSGTLYIGQVFGNFPFDYYECSNNMAIALAPIILYGAASDKNMDYVLYSSSYKDIKSNLKDNLLALLNKTGLYDTIVTDNYTIYCLLNKNLKEIGIEMNFKLLNPYNIFLTKYIGKMCSFKMEPEVLVDLMEEIKEGFRLLTVEDFSEEELLDMVGQDIVEEDDVIDEDDEEFFKDTTESDIVC